MEKLFILISLLGLAQGYYIFSSDGCPRDHVRCPHQGDCIRSRYVCDGQNNCHDGIDEMDCQKRRLDCAGGDLALCDSRVKPVCNGDAWEGLYIGPGPHKAVNETEVSMFAARVAVKLSQLKQEAYLEAERLINSVLYKAQKGRVSMDSVISTAPHNSYSPHSLPSPASPKNNSLTQD